MKRLLMFDFDGVIVDTYDYFKDAFLSSCEREGFSEIDNDEKFKLLFELNFYESMLLQGIPENKIANILDGMHECIRMSRKKYDFFPGMREALENLAEDNFIYIVTSNSSGAVETFLAEKGVDFINEVLGSDKGRSKVEKIKKLLTKHNDVDESWFIGDTKGDILEGIEAGVDTIAVTWGWHSIEALEEAIPYHVVDEPQELVLLFND